MNPFLYWFIIITGGPWFALIFRAKKYYEGDHKPKDFLTPRTIIVSNHTHILDYALMIIALVPHFPVTLVAEVVFTKGKVLNFLLKCLHVIRVERDTHTTNATNKAIEVLKQNKLLYVNPEGRIPLPEEGKVILPFHTGFVYMALATGAKIVPAYIDGHIFTLKRTNIIFGKPIDIKGMYNANISQEENVRTIARFFHDKVESLGEDFEKRKEKKK